jgi:hypothetical protein
VNDEGVSRTVRRVALTDKAIIGGDIEDS